MNAARMPSLCLASASPRRRQLLYQLGVHHIAAAADIDESPRSGESPLHYVKRMAREKAAQLQQDAVRSAGLAVLGADTSVVIDGRILGKPADFEHCCAMLAALSGRCHEVLSAVALAARGTIVVEVSVTQVWFGPITALAAQRYWQTGEPRDKAGGYAIQGLGAAFVKSIQGSYSGVMGLPLYETAQLLTAAGIPLWQPNEE